MSETPRRTTQLSREEIAAIEVGRTQISRAQQRVLIVAFLTIILAVPVVQAVRELRMGYGQPGAVKIFRYTADAAQVASTGRYLGELPIRVEAGPGLLSRLFASNRVALTGFHTYEDDLRGESLLTENLVGPAQYLLTKAAGAGNEKAYPGRDGWLFFRPGIDYCTAPGFLTDKSLIARAQSGTEWAAAPQPDPLIAIFDFHAQLLQRGCRLVLMPTPVKPVVHPEKFTRRFEGHDRPVQNASWDRFRAELADPELFFARWERILAPYRDVPVEKARRAWYWPLMQAVDRLAAQRERIVSQPVLLLDPSEALVADRVKTGQDQFLATDTHWTPSAMEATAARLAALLKESVPLGPARAPAFDRQSARIENQGDIAVMMQLPAWQDLYRPQAVEIHPVLVNDQLWRPAEWADVLLLGDSFSNIYSLAAMGWGESAGFAEQLSFALGRPLDAIRRNDAGAWATREMLAGQLAAGTDRLAGKKAVIWQFASRELLVGDWRIVPMDLGEASLDDEMLTLAPGETVEVTARVVAAAPAPRPGTVNYADHVIVVHVDAMEPTVAGTTIPRRQAMIAMYSMRGGQWTPAARYRPGQQIRLRLHNYGEYDRQFKVDSLVREELDPTMLAEPLWADDMTDAGAGVAAAVGWSWPEGLAILGSLLTACLAVGLGEALQGREERH